MKRNASASSSTATSSLADAIGAMGDTGGFVSDDVPPAADANSPTEYVEARAFAYTHNGVDMCIGARTNE